MTLVGGHRRDAEHGATGLGTHGSLGCADPGLGDVQPLRGQLVQGQQAVATPLARGDNGGRGRQNRAFASPDGVGRTPTARSPSGMCTSTINRKRRASDTNTSGAAEAISPSSSRRPHRADAG